MSPPSPVESLKPDRASTQFLMIENTIQTDGSATPPKNPSNQVLRVVIRSLPLELFEKLVLKELKSNFLPVVCSSSIQFHCVSVFLVSSCEGNKTFNVKSVCYLSVIIEWAPYPKTVLDVISIDTVNRSITLRELLSLDGGNKLCTKHMSCTN